MPLIIFHLNCVPLILLMMKMNKIKNNFSFILEKLEQRVKSPKSLDIHRRKE